MIYTRSYRFREPRFLRQAYAIKRRFNRFEGLLESLPGFRWWPRLAGLAGHVACPWCAGRCNVFNDELATPNFACPHCRRRGPLAELVAAMGLGRRRAA